MLLDLGKMQTPESNQELTELDTAVNNNEVENMEIPRRPETRHLTDKKGFIIFGIGAFVFVPFFIYAIVKSDARRITHGFDNCGNLCGIKNAKINNLNCSGQDYIDKPYSYYSIISFIKQENHKNGCMESCPDDKIMSTCFNWNRQSYAIDTDVVLNIADALLDRQTTLWWRFLFPVGVTIIVSLLVTVLFKIATALLIWVFLVFGLSLLVLYTLCVWYTYVYSNDGKGTNNVILPQLPVAFISTGFTFAGIMLIKILYKKISFVILLYKEASKTLFEMPGLLLLSTLTAIVKCIILSLFVPTIVLMATSADLKKISEDNYQFVSNGGIILAMILTLFVTIWIIHFVGDIQHMVIAGSITSWYFAKNKRNLESPIFTSISNAYKFHLGTLILGSFILLIIGVIKGSVMWVLVRIPKLEFSFGCCVYNLAGFVEFLSKNAYIETSIYGQSYFKAGRRAVRMLRANISSVISVNSVGDFVLSLTVTLSAIISTGISYSLFLDSDNCFFLTATSFAVNLYTAMTILYSTFEATVDSLFICFCEDNVVNDGTSRPYCMSRGLMEYVQKSKQTYDRINLI